MCLVDDLDTLWTYLGDTQPIARKVHRCDECGRDILPGERYDRAVGIMEGDMSVTKACAHCVAAREWLADVCGGWCYGGLRIDLEAHADDAPDGDPVRVLEQALYDGWDGWTPLDVVGVVGMGA